MLLEEGSFNTRRCRGRAVSHTNFVQEPWPQQLTDCSSRSPGMIANLKSLNPIDKSALFFGLRPDRKPRLRSVVLMVVCVTAICQIRMMLSACGGGGNAGITTTPPVLSHYSPT